MNKVLIVAAHPDDEVLGVGGTVLRHIGEGDEVYCIIMAEGMASRNPIDSENALLELKDDSKRVARFIGFKETFYFGFPDNCMDRINLLTVVKKVESVIDRVEPDIVYTHHEFDLNIDHRICFQSVITACRPISNKIDIYTFETLSSTEWQSKNRVNVFVPNTYVDISRFMDRKLEAMRLYRSELCEYPHPRSIEGIKILAQKRGLESGLKYAEGCHLVRRIR